MTKTDKLLAEPADQAPLPGPRGNADMTSPVDLPPPDEEEQHPLLWASIVISVTTGFLLLFNASALRSWAFELEPSPQNERVVAVAEGWYQQTETLYLDRPVAAMSDWWDGIKALEFGSGEGSANAGGAVEANPDPAIEGAESPAEEETEGPGFSLQ